MPKTKDQFEPRVRFNWGFHDGRDYHMRTDIIRRWTEKRSTTKDWRSALEAHDQTYYHGFEAGIQWAKNGRPNDDNTLSTDAWNEYCAAVKKIISDRQAAVTVDTITEYGITSRLSRPIRVF